MSFPKPNGSKTWALFISHVHTEYSLLDGACRIRTAGQGAPRSWARRPSPSPTTVSCTARSTSTRPARPQGIKPIIGCEVYVAPRRMDQKEHGLDNDYSHLILLCKDETGYRNLCYLVSAGLYRGLLHTAPDRLAAAP